MCVISMVVPFPIFHHPRHLLYRILLSDIALYIRNGLQFYMRNWAPKHHDAKVEDIKKEV
jgi:hypothetical protein